MNPGRDADLGEKKFCHFVNMLRSHSSNFSQQQNFHFMDTIPKQSLIGREVAVCHILVAYGSLQMVVIIFQFLSNDMCFPISIFSFVYRFKVQLSYFFGITLQQYYKVLVVLDAFSSHVVVALVVLCCSVVFHISLVALS